MHTKQKGNVGELKIALDLTEKGYFVFKELGDICKADLIVLNEDYDPIKVQVKYAEETNGKIVLDFRKSGPNYSFKYELKHVDVYAVFVPSTQQVLYVPNTLLTSRSSLILRNKPALNGQQTGIRLANDFLDFKKALRDCTRSTPSGNAGGNDTVQTTTV